MAIKTYKEHLEDLLKQDIRFVDDEGELMGNKVKSFTDDLDEKLIELLLQDERSRTQFFIKIKDVYVFKASEFKFFLEQNKIDNSFTNYINRIGLSIGGKFLKDNTDVVLDFPYKDCILEGGQSTEEGLDTYFEYDDVVSKTDAKKGYKPQQYNEKQAKRKEIFFNTIVAKDEIDRLLEPKAFANITKYDVNGESKPTSFTRDAAINKKRGLPADTITDNLIIKGNNLLALHTLKEEFKGKVKLIYIDPPYNTENDSFKYNDSFYHSSWLTFMRNRLIIAKELLCDEGVLFVSLDDKEAHYFKVLCDQVFERKNFIADICHKARASVSNDKIISPNHNHLLLYAKNERSIFARKEQFGIKNSLEGFNLNDENGDYKLVPVDGPGGASKGNPFYTFEGVEGYWRFSKETMQEMFDKGLVVRTENNLQQKYYKSKAASKKKTITTWWDKGFLTSSATSQLKKLMGEKVFNNPKNVNFLKRIIELWTEEGDIVLDFFAGSGSTAQGLLELNKEDGLNRRFILCEQLDYIKTVTVERIVKVIKQIKSNNSFTYLELAKNNQNAKDQIFACNSYEELMELFNNLYSNYFLHYNLKIKEFKEVVSKEEKFKALLLVTQKEIFCKMLDNNQLYVNVSEMEDSKHNISTEDIALTKDFYQIKE